MKRVLSDTFKESVKQIVQKIYDLGGSSFIENQVMVYKLSDPETFLNWSVEHGYLLHGSTRKIASSLVPYQAYDKTKESGNRKAVYLTKVPIVAMFCALTGGVTGLERRHRSHTRILENKVVYENIYFGVSDPELVANSGFIYIVEDCGLGEEINGECLSYSPVDPLAILEFKAESFPFQIEYF